MEKFKIAVIVGSLRKESYNLKTAKALIALASESLSLEILDISQLPMFNEDLEATPPNEWVTFRKQIAAADGIADLAQVSERFDDDVPHHHPQLSVPWPNGKRWNTL